MKKIIFTILAAIFALSIQAQTLRTSYFMDKYANRHQRNPAMSPAWGYINFPALGNFHLGLQSNMGLANFLFPVGDGSGRMKTFLHPDVSSNDFLRGISRFGEAFSVDANIGVLGFGFFTQGHRFWSFDLNLRAHGGMNIPKDFFVMLKELDSRTGRTYSFENMNASLRAYTEFAFGHARDINENIRVGAKFKFLVGLADARVRLDEFSIHTSQDVWSIDARGTATYLGLDGLGFRIDSNGVVDWRETFNVNINDIDFTTPRGFGAAIDLGVVWNMDNFLGSIFPLLPLNGFTFSAGLTDLGFIRYGRSQQAQAQGRVMHSSDLIVLRHGDSLRIDFDHLTDQLNEMVEFRPTTETSGMARGLRTTTNLGLEYSFLNNTMSAGLLWTSHFGLPRVFNELTLSYNLRPTSWFAFSLSSSLANGFFRSAGWAMNITPKWGLNFFFGMDYVPFAWTPRLNDFDWGTRFGVPIYNANLNFNFGMSIPLGGNRHHNFQTRRERQQQNTQ